MSETIKSVLINYAICSVLGGVLEYLSPEKARKTLRIVVLTVLLFSVLTPVMKSQKIDLQLDNAESEEISYDTLLHTANLIEKSIKNNIKEILINLGINEYEIYVTTSVDEAEGVVFLEDVRVEVGEEFSDKIETVKSKIPDDYKAVLYVGVKNE
ncbi:MAG: hypothetical protein ACI4IF_04940 [Acutalibacteraceae bacterium]